VATFGEPYKVLGAFMQHEPAVASPTVFVCLNCGFMEYYLLDEEALRIAAEKWPGVQAE
jgi:hypothetical protein